MGDGSWNTTLCNHVLSILAFWNRHQVVEACYNILGCNSFPVTTCNGFLLVAYAQFGYPVSYIVSGAPQLDQRQVEKCISRRCGMRWRELSLYLWTLAQWVGNGLGPWHWGFISECIGPHHHLATTPTLVASPPTCIKKVVVISCHGHLIALDNSLTTDELDQWRLLP